VEPCGGRGILDVRRRHIAVPAGLGSQDPDNAALGESGQRIDQRVNKVSVTCPPPKYGGIDHLVVVLVEKLRAREIFDIVSQVEVDVVVITEFLNQVPVFETQFLRHIYRSGGVGLAHVLLLCFVNCFMFSMALVISITPSQHPLSSRFKLLAPRSAIFCVTQGDQKAAGQLFVTQPVCP
jgi:hypothetical protein